MQQYPKSRQNELVVQELKGEILIYDLQTDKAFCLNETSALVWQLCDGNRDIAEISRQLNKMLKSPVNEDFVQLALDELKRENLLANGEEVVSESSVSRREMIRRAGLATAAALPIVFSIVAPTPGAAQSAAATAAHGQACVGSGRGNCALISDSCCGGVCKGNQFTDCTTGADCCGGSCGDPGGQNGSPYCLS